MDPINPWVDTQAVRKLAESLLMPVDQAVHSTVETCFGDEFVGFAGTDISSPTAAPVREAPAARAPGTTGREAPHPLREQARESLAGARQRAEQGGLLDRFPAPDRPETHSEPASTSPGAAPTTPAPPSRGETVPEPLTPDPRAATAVTDHPGATVEAPPSPPATVQAPFVERLHAYGQWLRSAVEAKAFFVTDRDGNVLMDQVRSPKLLQVARTLAQASHTASRHAGAGAVGSLHVKLGASSILEVLPVETSYGPLVLGIVVPGVLGTAAVPVISKGLEQVVNGHLS